MGRFWLGIFDLRAAASALATEDAFLDSSPASTLWSLDRVVSREEVEESLLLERLCVEFARI